MSKSISSSQPDVRPSPPQSKRIAGRIIPAIATTTAAVAGLMCLELYKLVQRHKKIGSYRTAYFVLGTQNFVWCKPRRAPRFQVSRRSHVHARAPSELLHATYCTDCAVREVVCVVLVRSAAE